MKILKLFLITILALSFANLNAQTESGKFLFGGSSKLGFSSVKTELSAEGESYDYSKTKTFNFSPQIGYFVMDGLAIGVEIPLTMEKSDFLMDEVKTTSLAYAIAPFARYYFGSNNIKPFLHGGLGIGSEKFKVESEGDSDETTHKIVLYSLGGGVGFFVNENVSFDCGLFYSSMTREFDDYMNSGVKVDEITKGFNFSVGLVVSF